MSRFHMKIWWTSGRNMQTLSITDIELIRSGVDYWSLNIVWIISDVMSWTTVRIPRIVVSLIRAGVCEIGLWLYASGLLSKDKFFVVWLQKIFVKSFVAVDDSVTLFKTELTSRYCLLYTTSAAIIPSSPVISLILIACLSEMSRWRELCHGMITTLSC